MRWIVLRNIVGSIRRNASERIDLILHLIIIVVLAIMLCTVFYVYGYNSANGRWKYLYEAEKRENTALKDSFRLKGWERMKVITITNEY